MRANEKTYRMVQNMVLDDAFLAGWRFEELSAAEDTHRVRGSCYIVLYYYSYL